MPNYVRNILKMEGIAELPLFNVAQGEKYFDFNLLIPMPAELMMEEGSKTERCVMYYLTERCSIQLQELDDKKLRVVSALVGNHFSSKWPEEVFRRVSEWMNDASDTEKDKAYADGRQYVSNYEKYGAATWYGWSIRNWGTKWNAGETVILDRDTIQFDTAWSNPAPIVQKLGNCIRPSGSNTGGRTRTLAKTPGTVSCSMAMSTWSVSPGIKMLWTFMRSVGVNAMTSTLTKMEKCSTATQMTEPAAMENDI